MKNNFAKLIAIVVAVCSIFIHFSCSSIEKIEGKDKAETYFLRGEAYLADNVYEKAIEKFSLVKNKFPYSPYAIEAELRLADTYYAKEDFVEAQRLYNTFSELHPKHVKRDYAIFKSGMSYFEILPSTIDRDLALAYKSIQEFKRLMEMYPGSPYFKDALNKYTECRIKLAEKEFYIGEFYRKQDEYLAAIQRYLGVLQSFSGLGLDEKAYYKIAYCYKQLGERDKSKDYINKIVANFPDGEFTKKAKSLYKD
jgi:outer membrane protein assembly factor BamD